jgi:Circularly permutated YpsA SLOG family
MPELVVISGGQSGVDRATVDEAIGRALPYGGWCPKGGWAEDFPEPPGLLAHYPLLRETPLGDPAQRTEWNLRDADATLVLTDVGGLTVSPGTALAQQLAARTGKPLLVIDLGAPDALARATEWLAALMAAHRPDSPFKLGIGGPRESEAPGIYRKARAFVGALLDRIPAR